MVLRADARVEDLLGRERAAPPTITEFLAQLGMAELAPVFAREQITPDMLPYIHDATLLQLGVTSVGDLVRAPREGAVMRAGVQALLMSAPCEQMPAPPAGAPEAGGGLTVSASSDHCGWG